MTEENSVIISERADKIFFPERKVVGSVDLTEIGSWAKLLKAKVPLYFYGNENEIYINDLQIALAKQQMALTDKILISEKNYLYKIILSK